MIHQVGRRLRIEIGEESRLGQGFDCRSKNRPVSFASDRKLLATGLRVDVKALRRRVAQLSLIHGNVRYGIVAVDETEYALVGLRARACAEHTVSNAGTANRVERRIVPAKPADGQSGESRAQAVSGEAYLGGW